MEAAIEEILDRVQLSDPEGSRERAVGAILVGVAEEPRQSWRKRLFGFLAALGLGGLIVLSPIGQAVGDLFRDDAPPGPEPSAEDRALTRIACDVLGSEADSVSWCDPSQTAGSADVTELLEDRGYMIDRYETAIAIRSPDGTVLVTGTDGLDPDEIPERFGHRWDELRAPSD